MMENIKIKRYRSFANYPYFLFEVEAEIDGEFVYVNMDVLKMKREVTCEEMLDSEKVWWYDAPVTEIDDFDEHYVEIADETLDALVNMMIDLWNENPQYIDDETWNEYK